MIATFVIIAALMVVAALVWVIVPLLRGAKGGAIAREASNVAVLRDQLRELDADVVNGIISRERYEQAKVELQQRVLEESKPASAGAPAVPSAAGAWTAAILGGTLPIAAIALYLVLGSFDAFAPQTKTAAGAEHDLSPQQVDAMIQKLVARLEQDPNNAQGWAILARTYYAMNRMQQAAVAFERAAALDSANAELLADYADALGSAQKGLDGKPLELVERALKVDPTQWKALALAGTAAFDRKDYKLAIDYWERLRAKVPPESNLAKSIAGSIAEARELGGIKATAVPVTPAAQATRSAPPASPAVAAAAPTPISGATVAGSVALSPALAGKAAPTDTVFVFARAAEGPKMPLAIMRRQVKDLPLTFALDDSMAMAPQMKISNFPEVVIGARVSKSGNATPQSGDLEGLSKPVKVGSNGIAIVIDTPRP